MNFLGPQTESDVREALRRADVFVLPSVVARDGQMEGLPVALMEALASGVPAISTALSGIPEIIEDGVTGLLVEPSSVAELADAVVRLVRDPALRERMGSAAVHRAHANFSAQAWFTRLLPIYRAAIEKRTPTSTAS